MNAYLNRLQVSCRVTHPANLEYGARWVTAALVALLIACMPARADSLPDPTGDWLVAKRIARIKIANCGNRMWGVVGWETTASTDKKNPDPKLRNRPTLGMPVLLGMSQTKPNKWDGKIYNSEDGNTYSANISLLNPNTLKVQGCMLGFLCGGENWTRIEPGSPDDLRTQSALPLDSRAQQAQTAPQPQNGRAQTQTTGRQANSPAPRSTAQAGNQAQAPDDVCLMLFGPSRLPH
ncbi:MAG: DUF2147 domain-containing protein [Pseudolabrys sp.]